mmetsp:Transcript_38178/g.92781  ORF Transcript_38178/g.92781 Transcript_38178/m.92781 type:complete len:118 (-) Transcript_38178:187-540(-)
MRTASLLDRCLCPYPSLGHLRGGRLSAPPRCLPSAHEARGVPCGLQHARGAQSTWMVKRTDDSSNTRIRDTSCMRLCAGRGSLRVGRLADRRTPRPCLWGEEALVPTETTTLVALAG